MPNVIKVPIQINGGTNPVALLERELYISFAEESGKTGYLYYGNSKGEVKKINAEHALTAGTATYVNSTNFKFDSESGNIGKIDISVDKNTTTLNGINTSTTTLKNMKLDSMSLENSKIKSLSGMTITQDMWGTTLPKGKFDAGSVFFLI